MKVVGQGVAKLLDGRQKLAGDVPVPATVVHEDMQDLWNQLGQVDLELGAQSC